MNNKQKYFKVTEESIREMMEQMFKEQSSKSRKVVLYTGGYMDEEGNIHCNFLEQLDKAMKEEINKRYPTCGEQYEKQNNEDEG